MARSQRSTYPRLRDASVPFRGLRELGRFELTLWKDVTYIKVNEENWVVGSLCLYIRSFLEGIRSITSHFESNFEQANLFEIM